MERSATMIFWELPMLANLEMQLCKYLHVFAQTLKPNI